MTGGTAMQGKRHGAMGAALALLTLLAALLCATSASPALARAAHSSAAADLRASSHTTLGSVGQDAPVTATTAPCLKKTQPERQQSRFAVPLIRALPTAPDALASARAHLPERVQHRGPAPSPPDLAELSVRRL
ncbi:hypothetical protein AB0L85_16240 [Streptomyces sp. NPDC052051]|uniref:hypothetical protein n=1 Tax=Streptomyces sp. NPDC052051 TaxID=3154649 RepID=UPI003415F08D